MVCDIIRASLDLCIGNIDPRQHEAWSMVTVIYLVYSVMCIHPRLKSCKHQTEGVVMLGSPCLLSKCEADIGFQILSHR